MLILLDILEKKDQLSLNDFIESLKEETKYGELASRIKEASSNLEENRVLYRVTSPDKNELIVYDSVLGRSLFCVHKGLYRNKCVAVKVYPFTRLTADDRKEIDVLKYFERFLPYNFFTFCIIPFSEFLIIHVSFGTMTHLKVFG